MVIMLMVTLIILPFEIAFHAALTPSDTRDDAEAVAARRQIQKQGVSWELFNYIVDFLFIIDVLLNFRTAYVDPNTEEVL